MSALIDKLQAFFSKGFFIGSFLPVLVCALINAVLLSATSERFRAFVRAQQPKDNIAGVLQGTLATFTLVVIAYFYSSSLVYLREVLEGKHWPTLLARMFTPYHSRYLDQLGSRLTSVKHDYARLNESHDTWVRDLKKARDEGNATRCLGYKRFSDAGLLRLIETQLRGEIPSFVALEACEKAVARELRKASANSVPELAQVQDAFVRLLAYAVSRYAAEIIDLINIRQYSFGEGKIAPTTVGNLANAAASYGLKRYGFSLEIGWSRLQKIVQADSTYYPVVQDVKAQLDSAISLFWLLVATTVGWSATLVFASASVGLFLTVAVFGPVSCWVIYKVVISSYWAFADVLRTVVDLYRFQLLSALHLPLPGGPTGERQLWDALRRQAEFGESAEIQYKHPAA